MVYTPHPVKPIVLGLAIIALLLLLSVTARGGIACGDIDADGQGPDISDLSYLIAFLYLADLSRRYWAVVISTVTALRTSAI